MCRKCIRLLNSAYSFKTKIIESEIVLRNYLSQKTKDVVETNENIGSTESEERMEDDCISEDQLETVEIGTNEVICETSNEDVSLQILEEHKLDNEEMKETKFYMDNRNDSSIKKCTYCNRMFVCEAMLKRHIAARHSEKKKVNRAIIIKENKKEKYYCEVCKTFLNSLDNYNKHLKKHKTLTCHICNRVCISNSRLELHLRMHSDERPFQCQICEKTFHSNSNLKVHLNIHFNDKKYKCPICDKRFITLSTLNTHLKIHPLDSEIPCSKCGKKLPNCVEYNLHMKSCPENFICKICNKKWDSIAQLNGHMNSHSELSLVCAYCGSTFTSNNNFMKHLKTHNSEEEVANEK